MLAYSPLCTWTGIHTAIGQWSSARQSVREFRAAHRSRWTIKHAFYADAGGFFLRTPDFQSIPIDAKQLLYLINHNYVDYPDLSELEIEDKNKVNVLLRVISASQTIWFTASMIARGIQGLAITGMELTTSAFIFCGLGTTYCWWFKGADVAVSIMLESTVSMATILLEGGEAASKPYHRTPLDFISREEWHWSLYWTHWINILRKMHIVFAPQALPHDRIENTVWLKMESRGTFPAFVVMSLAYSGIFLFGWNWHFPTFAEQLLWKVSSLSMMVAIALYFTVTAFAYLVYPAIRRRLNPTSAVPMMLSPQTSSRYNSTSGLDRTQLSSQSQKLLSTQQKIKSKLQKILARFRNNSVLRDPSLDVPLKATLPMYLIGFLYCSSRTIILILDLVQLRALPSSAFVTAEWSRLIPHLS